MAAHPVNLPPLSGLVLCGGQSSRMGTDKAWLDFHGVPQFLHAARLLKTCCATVVLSCRPDQVAKLTGRKFPVMADQPGLAGPMAGLLTVARRFPDMSWLVLGCDYPLVDQSLLQQLIAARSRGSDAVCFVDSSTTLAPFPGIYEASATPQLLREAGGVEYSLTKWLAGKSINRVVPPDPAMIRSVNTPQDVERVRGLLRSRA